MGTTEERGNKEKQNRRPCSRHLDETCDEHCDETTVTDGPSSNSQVGNSCHDEHNFASPMVMRRNSVLFRFFHGAILDTGYADGGIMRIDTTQIFLLDLKIRLNDVIGRTVAPVKIFGKKREEGQTRHSDHSYSKKKLNVFYLAKTTMSSYKVSDSRSGGAMNTILLRPWNAAEFSVVSFLPWCNPGY